MGIFLLDWLVGNISLYILIEFDINENLLNYYASSLSWHTHTHTHARTGFCQVARKEKTEPRFLNLTTSHNLVTPLSCMIFPRNHTNITTHSRTVPTHMSPTRTCTLMIERWKANILDLHHWLPEQSFVGREPSCEEVGNRTSQLATTSQPHILARISPHNLVM